MTENLAGILQSISALTVDTLETYRDGVCKTCDEVDSNIKSMYQVTKRKMLFLVVFFFPISVTLSIVLLFIFAMSWGHTTA